MKIVKTYEKYQNLNLINRYLHSFRYKWILSVFKELRSELFNNNPIKVLDIGCGPCKLYETLKKEKIQINYIGIDSEKEFFDYGLETYGHNNDFNIINAKIEDVIDNYDDIDIYTALESFEHMPEYKIPYLLNKISKKKPKLLACSVPVEVGPAIIIKNFGSKLIGYDRSPDYSWKDTLWAGIYQLDKISPHQEYKNGKMREHLGHKGFDWRWLKHNLRQCMNIVSINRSPFNFIPSALSPSIAFTAKPR